MPLSQTQLKNHDTFSKKEDIDNELPIQLTENSTKNTEILFSAIKQENVKLVQNMLNKSIDMNVTNDNNETPLHVIIKNSQNKKMLRLLLENDANLNIKDRDGLNSLHLAAHAGKLSFLKILLRHNNSTINDWTDNPNRETALHLASRSGHLKIIKYLLAHGADINKKTDNECGFTVLHSSSPCAKTTKLLLTSGISVNSLDNLNNTALHRVCTWGYKKSAQVLVDYKIDVNAVNAMNSTALDIIHSVIWRIKRRGWFVNPGTAPEETAMIVIKILTLKIITKEHVNEIDLRLLDSDELRGLYHQCNCEIEKMRKTNIYQECSVTIFDVLTREDRTIAKLFNNSQVSKQLQLMNFKQVFPIYANELKIRLLRAKEMHSLMQLCSRFLNQITGNRLHDFLINEILHYLSEQDMKVLSENFT